MDAQIAQVKQQYSQLSSTEQGVLSGAGSDASPVPRRGVAIAVVNAALGEQVRPTCGVSTAGRGRLLGPGAVGLPAGGKSLLSSTARRSRQAQPCPRASSKLGDAIFYCGSARRA